MEAARARAGPDRDEGVPAPTSARIQLSGMRPACEISRQNKKILKFFEMSGSKIFRKG
jgi:hypothetical protein